MVQQSEEYSDFLQSYYNKDKFIRMNGLPIFIRKTKYGNVANCQPGYSSYAPTLPDEIMKIFNMLRGFDVDIFTYVTAPLFLKNMKSKLFNLFDTTIVNPIQYVNLRSVGNVMDNYRSDVKFKIRKINKKKVLSVKTGNEYLSEWYKIHVKRSLEQKSQVIEYDYFRKLLELDNSYLSCVFYKNMMIGGAIFLKNEYHVDYYRSAFDSKYFYLDGNTFLLNEELNIAKMQDISVFNMHSSAKINDGTWNFKKGFGCYETEHYYLIKQLGNVHGFLHSPVKEIKRMFKGYYVLPYNKISKYKKGGMKLEEKYS